MDGNNTETKMNTYAILVDDGYGFKDGMGAFDYIKANTPQAARKIFKAKWEGNWRIEDPKSYRARRMI